jgi:TRAP-type C4-dicarboxylate transport system permease small subunit
MGIVNLLLWGAGVVLVVVGYTRAAPAWRRYSALQAQDENVRRYEQWRGGPRQDDKTGASVAMDMLRGQARRWAAVAIVGVVLIFLGFFVRA